MQAGRLEEQHRDEQVRLVAEDEPLYIPRGACPGGRERQHAEHDVRIGALGVRVGMMPAVLAGPPAVAEPGAEVAARDTEEVVGPPGAEDLAVPGIVAEKAELGKGSGEEDRDSHLPP